MPSHRRLPKRPRLGRKSIDRFDPKAFLASVGIGRTVHQYRQNQVVFSQGERADVVYYIQTGRCGSACFRRAARKRLSGCLVGGDFLGEGASLPISRFVWPRLRPLPHCSLLRIDRSEMLRTLHKEPRSSPTCSSRTWSGATTGRNRTWWINSSIPAKNGWRERSCYWRTSARKAIPYSDSQRDAGDTGGNDWHHSFAREYLPEQIQKAWFHRLQGGLQVHSSLLSVVLHD